MRTRQSGWALTPAFDVIHSYRPGSEWTTRHNLRVNGKTEEITTKDLYAVGDRHEVPGYKRIVREVMEVVDGWSEFATRAELDATYIDAVAADLNRFRPV
jgi:serine/threonine-protein kinase HipA